MPRKLPSAEFLLQFVSYNPESGQFTWIGEDAPRRRKNSLMQTRDTAGYIILRIEGKNHKAHRVAWHLEKGEDPGKFEVDHINGNKIDNRIVNLRLSTRGQNRANSTHNKGSKSGIKGVYWCKNQKKWRAQITTNKKVIKLGSFTDPFEAHMAYREAAVKYHGEFANFG